MNKLLLLVIAFGTSISLFAQIEYTNAPPMDAETLVERLRGNGVEVFNAELTCADDASGFFWNGSSTNLGIESGIVLTTGSTEVAFSANTIGDASVSNGGGWYSPFEDYFPWAFVSIHDACVLEFDFIPYGDEINLNYIFGSEEYPEYVGSSFNDVFGFFIEGLPEYPEDMSFIERNIATIPTSPGVNVSINNLNFGAYNQFYQDNIDDPYIQYDGQTVRLPAKAKVTPCNTYHLSLAIADMSDTTYDSGLFIEEGSMRSNIFQNHSVSTNVDENSDMAFEGSDFGFFSFSQEFGREEGELWQILSEPSPNRPISLVLGGTATLFEDYTFDKESLIFPEVEESEELFPEALIEKLKVTPIVDDLDEGLEYVTLGVYSTCIEDYLSIDTLWIADVLQTGVEEGGTICFGDSFQLSVFGGDESMTYEWTPAETLDSPNSATPIASPTETTNYVVTVMGENGYEAQHAVTIEVEEEVFANLTVSSNQICPSSIAVLTTTPSIFTNTYTFYNQDGEVIPSSSIYAIVYPEITTTYTVVVTSEVGCTASDEVTIEVENNLVEIAEQFIACEGESFVLPTVSNADGLQYEWSPNVGLDNSLILNPTIIATGETMTYTLLAVSDLGCMDSVKTTIEVTNDCVYPGDTDNSGVVDMFDLFPIGRSFDKSGNARNTISNEWQGFGVKDWNETGSNGQDLKYIDCNGNGTIGFEDMSAIVLNFRLEQKSGGFAKGKLGDPELQFLPKFDKIEAGELLELEVWIGSELNPVTDLYAIAFETFFDIDLIEAASISLDYSESDFGVVGEDLLVADWVNHENGRINASFTKVNGIGASGSLHLLTIQMRSQSELTNPENFGFHITDFGANDSEEGELLVNVDEMPTIVIEPDIVDIEVLTASKPYHVYPTFTQDGFYLHYSLQRNPIVELTLFSLSGEQVVVLQQEKSSLGGFEAYIDLKERDLASGIYILELKVEGEIYREKIIFY